MAGPPFCFFAPFSRRGMGVVLFPSGFSRSSRFTPSKTVFLGEFSGCWRASLRASFVFCFSPSGSEGGLWGERPPRSGGWFCSGGWLRRFCLVVGFAAPSPRPQAGGGMGQALAHMRARSKVLI